MKQFLRHFLSKQILGLALILCTPFATQSGTVSAMVPPGILATITFPDDACVGQEYTITATLNNTTPTTQPAFNWFGLIPPTVEATFVSATPSIGTFDPTVIPPNPLANGLGEWIIEGDELPIGISTLVLTVRFVASTTYTSLYAGNLSVLIGPVVVGLNLSRLTANPKTGSACSPSGTVSFDATAGNTGCNPLSLVSVTQPTNGGTVVTMGNTFTYTAPTQLPSSGSDSFTYTITDSLGTTTATGQVTISLTNCVPPVPPCKQTVAPNSFLALYDQLVLNESVG